MTSRHAGDKEDIPLIFMLFLFYTINSIINNIKNKSDSLNLNDEILTLVQTPPYPLYKYM